METIAFRNTDERMDVEEYQNELVQKLDSDIDGPDFMVCVIMTYDEFAMLAPYFAEQKEVKEIRDGGVKQAKYTDYNYHGISVPAPYKNLTDGGLYRGLQIWVSRRQKEST